MGRVLLVSLVVVGGKRDKVREGVLYWEEGRKEGRKERRKEAFFFCLF